jgi:hypothetical protein
MLRTCSIFNCLKLLYIITSKFKHRLETKVQTYQVIDFLAVYHAGASLFFFGENLRGRGPYRDFIELKTLQGYKLKRGEGKERRNNTGIKEHQKKRKGKEGSLSGVW